MSMFMDLKVLLRSKSYTFVKARYALPPGSEPSLETLTWNGRRVVYRPGTSDVGLIYEILLRDPKRAEYRVDPSVKPGVIFDIGANIGITALWLNRLYPRAKIFCFEPMPENLKLLQENTLGISEITVLPFGLGALDTNAPIYPNIDRNNRGGYSLYRRETDPQNLGNSQNPESFIEIRSTARVLNELDIDKIDLLKIDTEGSEFDILSDIPNSLLENCSWVMGELHGIKTFETLALLSRYFRIGLKKAVNSEVFTFEALNARLLRDDKYAVGRQ